VRRTLLRPCIDNPHPRSEHTPDLRASGIAGAVLAAPVSKRTDRFLRFRLTRPVQHTWRCQQRDFAIRSDQCLLRVRLARNPPSHPVHRRFILLLRHRPRWDGSHDLLYLLPSVCLVGLTRALRFRNLVRFLLGLGPRVEKGETGRPHTFLISLGQPLGEICFADLLNGDGTLGRFAVPVVHQPLLDASSSGGRTATNSL
jgi:hypothetical protein